MPAGRAHWRSKIGITDSPRELVFSSAQTPSEVEELVSNARATAATLTDGRAVAWRAGSPMSRSVSGCPPGGLRRRGGRRSRVAEGCYERKRDVGQPLNRELHGA